MLGSVPVNVKSLCGGLVSYLLQLSCARALTVELGKHSLPNRIRSGSSFGFGRCERRGYPERPR